MRWQELVRQILALRPDWNAAELGAFRFLEGGYSNENYRFRHEDAEFVLRLPGRPNGYVDREREGRFYASMRALAMPEVIGFDPGTGVMITRWISGRLLTDLDPSTDRLAHYLRDLHGRLSSAAGTAADPQRRYDPLAQARAALTMAVAPDWIRAFADALEWHPPVLTLCHNDLNPWNVIEAADGTWITLDWEWVGTNDPLFDLVALHQGLAKDDASLPSMAESLSGGVAEPGRLQACLAAFWLREYSWANAEIAGGSARPEVLAQRDLGERKLSALARLIAQLRGPQSTA